MTIPDHAAKAREIVDLNVSYRDNMRVVDDDDLLDAIAAALRAADAAGYQRGREEGAAMERAMWMDGLDKRDRHPADTGDGDG